MKKELEKKLKKKIYRAVKFSHQPKARWAEMGSHSQDFPLPKKQMPSNCHIMFERYHERVIYEGMGVLWSSSGLRAEPPKWSF